MPVTPEQAKQELQRRAAIQELDRRERERQTISPPVDPEVLAEVKKALGTTKPQLAEKAIRQLREEHPAFFAVGMAAHKADPFGLRQFIIRHIGKYITPKHPEVLPLILDTLNKVQQETSLKDWQKYPGIAGQIGGAMAEFGALGGVGKAGGTLGTAKKFAAARLLRAPTAQEEQQPLGETIKQRGVGALEAAGTGAALNIVGKVVPNPLYRIPAVTGGFMGLTSLQGGNREQILESGITVLGFEAVGLAQRGLHKQAIQKAIENNPELTEADPKALEEGVKKVGELANEPASESKVVVEKLIPEVKKGLKLQQKARKEVKIAQSKERGRRSVKAFELRDELIAKGMSIEEATTKSTAMLKGELTGDEYNIPEEARPKLTDAEWATLQKTAFEKYPERFRYYTQLQAKEAIAKIRDGKVLQNSEIALMGDIFGAKLAKMLQKQQPFYDRLLGNIYDIGGFSKSVVASGDISYTFRQLLPVLFRSPRVWAKSVGRQTKAFFSEKAFERYQNEIKDSKYYKEAMKHRLPLTDMGEFKPLETLEEAYPTRIAKKWPLMKQGNRAAVAAANQARMGLYEKIREQWNRSGVEITDTRLEKLSKYIGDLTGRSVLPKGRKTTNLANFLNALTFSPRFALSRVKNVGTLFHTLDTDPAIFIEGLKTLAGGFTTIGLMALIANMFGHEIEVNPKSADFMKSKKDNTRYDLLGGHGQIIRFIVRMATGKTKTAAGKTKEIPRSDVVLQFAKSKRAPILGLIWSLYTGKDFAGKDIKTHEGWTRTAINQFTYLWLQDAIEAFEDRIKSENIGEALGITGVAGGLSWVGLGVQTYEPTARTSVAVLKDSLAQTKYGKTWETLNPRQQRLLERQHKQELAPFEQQVATEQAQTQDYEYVGRLLESNRKAGDTALKVVAKPVRDELMRLGIILLLPDTIRNYKLNDDLYKEYQQIVGQQLKKRLERLMLSPMWSRHFYDAQKRRIEQEIASAKRAAQREILRKARQQ